MNLTGLLSASGKAFLIALVLTPIIRDVFRSYNVVDRPGRRKVHAYPIPRVGGVPIMAAYCATLLSLRGAEDLFPAHWMQLILSGAVIIFLTGLIDDFMNLRATVKLMGQIVAGVVAFQNGIRIDTLAGFDLPVYAAMPLTVFWLLLSTNALNLIDGLDGLCSGMGFWATLTIMVASLMTGNYVLAYTAAPLAGALLGFLFFNFNPATVFLGDSGALLIGYLLGCFGILWNAHHATAAGMAVPLFGMTIPLADLSISIVRRTLKAQGIFSPDRGHTHHRLLDHGLSVRASAFTLYGAAMVGGGFGLLLLYLEMENRGPNAGALQVVVLIAAAACLVAGIRQLRYAEFEVAGQLLFNGEFRNVVAQKVRLRNLSAALDRAGSQDDWWRALSSAAREEDWIRLRWVSAQTPQAETTFSERAPSWCFTVEIGADESLLVEGDSTGARGSSDLVAWSGVLSRSLERNRPRWVQPARS